MFFLVNVCNDGYGVIYLFINRIKICIEWEKVLSNFLI